MAKKRKQRRLKGRLMYKREEVFGVRPSFEVTALRQAVRIDRIGDHHIEFSPPHTLVVKFRLNCPCCDKGISGEIHAAL